MEETTYQKNQRFLHTIVSVFIDICKGEWCEGNSREMKRVRVKGSTSLVGQIVDATIFKAETWMLWGRFVDEEIE